MGIMKNKKIERNIKTAIIAAMILGTMGLNPVHANNEEIIIKEVEYSEDYKKYLELSEEEKKDVLEPLKYDIVIDKKIEETKNPFKMYAYVTASDISKFDLRDVIPENIVVKNQQETSACWSFAAIGALESVLGMNNYKIGNTAIGYDYSERHMVYGSTYNAFNNNEKNKYGIYKEMIAGGTILDVERYMLNGMGMVKEVDMPFENNEDIIDIAEIQGKNTEATIYDTQYFESLRYAENSDEIENLKIKMKEHIQNIGGIYAMIHGAALQSNYYNMDTGAIYCDNSFMAPINHGVVVIGWDDDYSVENFKEGTRPENNGAWIIKNSWGEKLEYTKDQMKNMMFDQLKTKFNWETTEDITEDQFQTVLNENSEYKYNEEKDNYYISIGDNGCMYISYEDVNIYKGLLGIDRAEQEKTYDQIYQNDLTGVTDAYSVNKGTDNKLLLGNVYQRNMSENEYIDRIEVHTYQEYQDCKVYVNPKGGLDEEKLIEVKLKAGDTVDIMPGNKSIEFANPICVDGDEFSIVLEIQAPERDGIYISLEREEIKGVIVNEGESFYKIKTGNEDEWIDLALSEEYGPANLCIKAYTTTNVNLIEKLEIENEPTKIEYFEGEDFDKTGMKINAKYEDGTIKEITEYTVNNGENLELGQTSVGITYTELGVTKTVEQAIIVEKIGLESLRISEEPVKTEYVEGEDFDVAGMKIIARYSNEFEKEITDYEVVDGGKLSLEQTTVTISYTENDITKTVVQDITVTEKKEEVKDEILLTKLEITKEPTKVEYIENEDFDKTGMEVKAIYSDETEKEITEYSVIDGENLSLGQTRVTISYTEDDITKTIIQEITVTEKKEENKNEDKEIVLNDYTNAQSDMIEFNGNSTRIKIDNIEIQDDTLDSKYYIYLSSYANEENIDDECFVVIEDNEMEVENTKLSINKLLTSADIEKYPNLTQTDNIYVYIKQVATSNQETKEGVSVIKTEVKVDVEKPSIDNSNTNNEKDEQIQDNTLSNNKLPDTGRKIIITVFMIAVFVIGVFNYKKFKNTIVK